MSNCQENKIRLGGWGWGRYRMQAPLVAQMVKSSPAMQETQVQSLGQKDPVEKGMATLGSILSWRAHE